MLVSLFTIILGSNILHLSINYCILISQIPFQLLKGLQGFLAAHFESYINCSIAFFINDREEILTTIWGQDDQTVNWIVHSTFMENCVAVLFPMEEVASVAYQYFQTFDMVGSNCDEKGCIPMSFNQFN